MACGEFDDRLLLAELGTSRVSVIAPARYYNQHELMTEPKSKG